MGARVLYYLCSILRLCLWVNNCILGKIMLFIRSILAYPRKKQYICSKFVNLLLCDGYYSSF